MIKKIIKLISKNKINIKITNTIKYNRKVKQVTRSKHGVIIELQSKVDEFRLFGLVIWIWETQLAIQRVAKCRSCEIFVCLYSFVDRAWDRDEFVGQRSNWGICFHFRYSSSSRALSIAILFLHFFLRKYPFNFPPS